MKKDSDQIELFKLDPPPEVFKKDGFDLIVTRANRQFGQLRRHINKQTARALRAIDERFAVDLEDLANEARTIAADRKRH